MDQEYNIRMSYICAIVCFFISRSFGGCEDYFFSIYGEGSELACIFVRKVGIPPTKLASRILCGDDMILLLANGRSQCTTACGFHQPA